MQFPPTAIHKLDKHDYWFECAMISTCRPVFDKCADNYDVERVLRAAKVIGSLNRTDTESCALVVRFQSKETAEGFLTRLNTFLRKYELPTLPSP